MNRIIPTFAPADPDHSGPGNRVGTVVAPENTLSQEARTGCRKDLEIKVEGCEFGLRNLRLAAAEQAGEQTPVGGKDPVDLSQIFFLLPPLPVVKVAAAAVIAEFLVRASVKRSAALEAKSHLFFCAKIMRQDTEKKFGCEIYVFSKKTRKIQFFTAGSTSGAIRL